MPKARKEIPNLEEMVRGGKKSLSDTMRELRKYCALMNWDMYYCMMEQ